MKRILQFIIDVIWADYSVKHRIFTGEFPDNKEKPNIVKGK